MGISLAPMPQVHPWMIAPSGPVTGSAKQLQAVAEQVNSAGELLQTTLGQAGGVLGWRSSGAESAREPLVQAHSEVGMLRDVTTRAAMSLHSLGATMSEHGPELAKLKTRREELEVEASLIHDEAGGQSPHIDALIEDAGRVDRQMTHHIEMLARADRTTRDDLNRVVDELRTLGSADREDEWVGDMAPPEVVALLGRYGVTESAAERALLDQIMLLPDGPAGDEALRKLLGEMTPDELADFLLRHPDVARRLVAAPLGSPGAYPPGSAEALLATAVAAGRNLPPKERIAAIRSAFAAMSPEDQKRMALLYPGLVGNLDGAPLDLRMAANRVHIGVALDDERAKQVDATRDVVARTPREAWWGKQNSETWFTYIVDLDDPDSAEYRNTKRIDYYQQLLYEEVTQPGPRRSTVGDPGSDKVAYDQHQILYFDPTGDGQIAEMWGTIGPETRNVAVFVPGTTSDLENFKGDSEKMRALAGMDPTGQTVGITWLGTNMPDAVAANATQNKYAEEGGPKLRDFVWGLDIPPEKRVTAIGHSYGGAVVGVADREGLEVDAVVHVASAGTGRGVDSAADYPDGVDGKERYTMTAPGDPISYIQGGDYVQEWGVGHGSDPDETEGFTQLETGRYKDDFGSDDDDKKVAKRGRMIAGNDAHADVTRPGTTSFDNIYGVVTGGEVTSYTEPGRKQYDPPPGNPMYPWGNDTEGPKHYPYRNPNFDGPTHDIPDDAGR
jgi:pimeloyl-ACP methyl ester carboxylesterase